MLPAEIVEPVAYSLADRGEVGYTLFHDPEVFNW
jgi:hypothetical protein